MNHSFDVNIAQKYGVHAAVLLQNITFWCLKNKGNGVHEHDGNFWTYNSKKAFAELFPYMTPRQIDYALKRLIDDGIIITGNYNANAYDRTLWYAVTKKGFCIQQICEMESTKNVNGNAEIVEPIPDIKPDEKQTDVKPDKKTYTQICDRLNEKAGTAYRSTSAATQRLIKARFAEGFTLEDFYAVIDKKCAEWKGTDYERYLRPETLFGSKFEGYLNGKAGKGNKGTWDDRYYKPSESTEPRSEFNFDFE